ncbi:hypothetical protein DL769_003913 [Monosporascus sp. CRB-8-3]|nr:hypothetical protein DL769_003913 [Monosporascus sp. CRB-8-3]
MKTHAAAAGIAFALAAPALAGYNDSTTFPASLQPTEEALHLCPAECSGPGIADGSWSSVLSLGELSRCSKPLLFDTSIRFPIEAPGRQTFIRACTAASDLGQLKDAGPPCVPGMNHTSTQADLQVGWTSGDGVTASLSDLIQSAGDLQHSVVRDVSCGQTILFAKSGDAVLGLYAGSEIEKASIGPIIQQFIKFISSRSSGSLPSDMAMQICGPDGERSVTYVIGIAASARGDFHAVQDALGKWADAECLSGFGETKMIRGQRITTLPGPAVTAGRLRAFGKAMADDDECEYVIVHSGNTCDLLADRCGIGTDELIGYNGGDEDWCSSLTPNEPVCCSEGEVPDLRPPPNEDGSCAVHTIEADELCHKIEEKYYLEEDDLDKFNVGKTWGWAGCEKIQPGQKICVSDGDPPMPTYVKDAICGPQVPGTERPDNDSELADLNQCPLNVCCNIWGHCGTDEDFCIDTSIEDTPGTAENGTNGCISNCGLDVVNNDEPPPEFNRIAYFEAFNRERPCLHMDVTDIGHPYTIIHFAFGHITDNYQVSAQGSESQFKRLVEIQDKKRVMSFGGWAFSNDPATSHIIRDGVKSENRQAFADNVVKFVEDNHLDGVDFDWEYPGANDIPGSDPGTLEDGSNYLEFLKLVREGLGDDKILAIAAPASYWYLRHFPIADISKVVSYIVYMTYDLHGQWDVDNKFVSPGCPEGNCLRSHVNSTITKNALAMVTKAGVQANKIMVGVSSYGRSFKMAEAGCTDPMCHYLGERNESPAMPGECTETAGYIADAEILKIKEDDNYTVDQYYDHGSDSDIFIYNDVEWIGWMGPETKERRTGKYKALNFAGTSDWAVDLQGDINSDDGETVYIGDEVYEDPQMQCEAPCTIVLAPSPLLETTTISIPPYTTSLEAGTETVTVTVTPEAITTTQIEFYNIPISLMGGNTTEIQPYPSLTVEDVTVTYTFENGDEILTSSRNVTLPPWPLITRGPPEDGDDDWDEPPEITTPDPTGTVGPGPPLEYHTPTWGGWYEIPATITPIPENPEEPEMEEPEDEDDPPIIKVGCDTWFFDSCEEGTGGWEWRIPPGVIPPGPPPPPVIDMPGMTVEGSLPPWPPLTIPTPGGPPPTIPPKPDPCEPATASICGTTTSYGSSEGPSTTITTTTTSWSTCRTIVGCHVSDWEDGTTTGDGCTISARALPTRFDTVTTTGLGDSSPAEPTEVAKIERRQQDCARTEVLILPVDIRNPDPVNRVLEELITSQDPARKIAKIARKNVHEVIGYEDTAEQYTAWWYVQAFPKDLIGQVHSQNSAIISRIYDPSDYAERNWPGDAEAANKDIDGWRDDDDDDEGPGEAPSEHLYRPYSHLEKRAGTDKRSKDYANALLSAPKDAMHFWENNPHIKQGEMYRYHSDDTDGKGQKVYAIESAFDLSHSELKGATVEDSPDELSVPAWYYGRSTDPRHGTRVASVIVGQTIGTARRATLVPVRSGHEGHAPQAAVHGFMLALDHIHRNTNRDPGYKYESVINFSVAIPESSVPPEFRRIWREILRMAGDLDVPLVVAAGNRRNPDSVLPQKWLKRDPKSFLVGTVDQCGIIGAGSGRYSDPKETEDLITYAAGVKVLLADYGGGDLKPRTGTSYATPRVAGLVAYLRALPSNPWTQEARRPTTLKKLVEKLSDTKIPMDGECSRDVPDGAMVHVWNGQVPQSTTRSKSCLLEKGPLEYGYTGNACCDLRSGGARAACGGSGGGGIGDLPVPGPITWDEGKPSPTCTANCGKACDGFWCNAQPTGTPPDYEDPNPPDDGGDDDDDDGEPSPYNYGIVWGADDCNLEGTSEYGMEL